MKKHIPLLIILLISSCFLSAQHHVFILVDVSGSRGSDPIKTEAKNQIYNLISGQYTSNGWLPVTLTDKTIKDIINGVSKQPLVGPNFWVCMVPFGNKDSYKRFKIIKNVNSPLDFQNFFNSNYPTYFTESFTYIQIAEAFTASLAKTYNINEYYMFIVTDGLGDQDDTNSKNNYDSFEESLLLAWNNSSSSIVANIGAITKSKYYINLRKVTNVTGSSIPQNPNITPPSLISDTASIASIKITSPANGKKNKEIQLKTENLNVSWTCNNCPEGIKYNVMVVQYEGGNFRENRKDIQSNSISFKIPSGKFKIIVSASNCPESTSDYTCVKAPGGGVGWLLALALIGAVGGTGYYMWNKKRQLKTESKLSNKADDVFSKMSSNSTNKTTNSDYF